MTSQNRVVVTCMKNEGPYVLEWIAHHLALGFTHFVVMSNDCADGTDKLLDSLEKTGYVTHKPNPAPHNRGPQKTGYLRARSLPAVLSADWLITLDVDEFINIHAGDGKFDDLVAGMNDANMYSFQWQFFGHGGVMDYVDRPLTEQLIKSAHPDAIRPYHLRGFKTMYKRELYERLGTHRPNVVIEEYRDQVQWAFADGRRVPQEYIDKGWICPAPEDEGETKPFSQLARLNHYAVRSFDSFMIKRDRGDVNPNSGNEKLLGNGMNYWRQYCWNDVEDKSIQKYGAETRQIMREFLADPEIGKWHDFGVAWHTQRAEELSEQPEMIELRQTITALERHKDFIRSKQANDIAS